MPPLPSKKLQPPPKPALGPSIDKNQKQPRPSRVSVLKPEASFTGEGDELDAWLKGKVLRKPDDQLKLTDDELKEEITRVLTVTNPRLPENIVQYSFKEGSYLPVPLPGNQVILLDEEGTSLHIESEEAKKQIAAEGGIVPAIVKKVASAKPTTDVAPSEEKEEEEVEDEGDKDKEEEDEEEKEGKEKDDDDDNDEEKEDKEEGEEVEPGPEQEEEVQREDSVPEVQPVTQTSKKLTNQFNFCERASLTYNLPMREVASQTIPPPRSTFSDQVMQWTIYDAYQEDFEAQEREKEKEKKEKTLVLARRDDVKKKEGPTITDRSLLAVKTLERMINLNTFDEIAQDYRYWDDPSDEYRENEGTLLPLWKFTYEKTKKNSVTDICWNPCFYDLFAVAFGGFDFMKQHSEGAVCLFTLKNPSYPEYVCTMESGVSCIDIHSKYPHLLAVGKYDGSVAVYNVNIPSNRPQYESSSTTNKHGGTVWQIKWGRDMPDGEVNFYSVSGDGHVYNWVLMQNEMSRTVVLPLHTPSGPVTGPEGVLIPSMGCGSTVAFHPTDPLIYLVGTEEGHIYKCSTAYSSMYLATYKAHYMPVTKMNYNKFYPQIFVSCSADWRVKIWEDKRSEPLFVFDLGCPIGDVDWSPYSSTVFGAATLDGRLHVFDLNVDKYKAICVQNIVSKKKNKLTRMAFNYKLPILIAGDDRGTIVSLKLSPNLRKEEKPPKKGPRLTPQQLEIQKLERLLALVREPPTLSTPADLPTTKQT